MVKEKATDVALIVKELEKTRAALTVLYEQASKEQKALSEDQKVIATKVAQLTQRCRASEARLKRLENTIQGDSLNNPGIVTQLWNLQQKIETIDLPKSDTNSSISRISLDSPSLPSVRPPSSMSVHPIWIQVVLPTLFFLVAALVAVCIWLAT